MCTVKYCGVELLDGEEMRAVVGYEGLYVVSNLGGLWKLKKGKLKAIGQYRKNPKYIRVGMSKDGNRSWKNIHVLVANAFVLNPDNKPFVNHIDGDKLNSRADNLEWCTTMENHQHACDMGLNKHFKLSAIDKHEICMAFYSGLATVKQLSKRYGVVVSGIRRHIKNYEKLQRDLPLRGTA
jgi:hypothetical protein